MINKRRFRRSRKYYQNKSINLDSSNDGILDVLANTVGILILIGVLGALAVANSVFEIYAPMNREAKKYVHLFHISESGIWDLDPAREALIKIDKNRNLFKKNCIKDGYTKTYCIEKASKFNDSGYISNVRYVFNDSNQYVERDDNPQFGISGFSGIGVLTQQIIGGDNVVEGVKILEIYDGTPASKSKLVIGDIIQTVNGKTLTSKEFVSKNYGIKGPRNTIVSLGIKGKGKYNIRRDYIKVFIQKDLNELEILIKEIKKQDKVIFVVLEPSGFEGFKEIQKIAKKYDVDLGWDAWEDGKKRITFGKGRSMTVQ